MRKDRLIKLVICSIALLMHTFNSIAQTDTSITAPGEFFRMQGNYLNANHLGFSVIYYSETADSVSTKRDTLRGDYQINGDNYVVNIDSTVQVQNNTYHVTASIRDSFVLVQQAASFYPSLFRIDMSDSLFLNMNVQSVSFSDSATVRHMSISFANDAPYLSYDLYYDKNTYYINKMVMVTKNTFFITPAPGMGLGLPANYVSITAVFSGYSTGGFTDSVFSTDRFFVFVNGAMQLVSPYNNLDFSNQTQQ